MERLSINLDKEKLNVMAEFLYIDGINVISYICSACSLAIAQVYRAEARPQQPTTATNYSDPLLSFIYMHIYIFSERLNR